MTIDTHSPLTPNSIRDGYKLVDRVHAYLRNAILQGDLAPGTRLNEAELARNLGVSRSPVRDAITRLEQENLVVISKLQVMVCALSASEVEDLFWIRYAMEGVAARLAAARLTGPNLEQMRTLCVWMQEAYERGDFLAVSENGNQFHNVFIQGSGNPRLIRMLGDVKSYIDRFRSITAGKHGRGPETVREHWAILRAFEKCDPDAAELLVRRHVQGAHLALLEQERSA